MLDKAFWMKIWTSELFSGVTEDVDWIRVTLNLIHLMKFDEKSIEKVFSQDYLCEVFDGTTDQRPETKNKFLSLLRIYQSVKLAGAELTVNIDNNSYVEKAIEIELDKNSDCPLQSYLESEFGCHKVLTLVKSKYGHIIQHVLKLDKISGKFVNFNEAMFAGRDQRTIPLETIECDQNEIL